MISEFCFHRVIGHLSHIQSKSRFLKSSYHLPFTEIAEVPTPFLGWTRAVVSCHLCEIRSFAYLGDDFQRFTMLFNKNVTYSSFPWFSFCQSSFLVASLRNNILFMNALNPRALIKQLHLLGIIEGFYLHVCRMFPRRRNERT